jgi:hypothetical protein
VVWFVIVSTTHYCSWTLRPGVLLPFVIVLVLLFPYPAALLFGILVCFLGISAYSTLKNVLVLAQHPSLKGGKGRGVCTPHCE